MTACRTNRIRKLLDVDKIKDVRMNFGKINCCNKMRRDVVLDQRSLCKMQCERMINLKKRPKFKHFAQTFEWISLISKNSSNLLNFRLKWPFNFTV